MPVSAARMQRDLDAIARFTQTPGAGRTAPTFSPQWRAATDYVAEQLRGLGCQVRLDAAGNLRARPEGVAWSAPAWLSGSHLDSVPHGGDYDGVAGVVVPLEVLRAAHEDGLRPLPLELIAFAEEEGTTFGGGMLGSRALVGQLSAERLATYRNAAGEDYLAAGAPHGVCPEELTRDSLRPDAFRGFVEVHIEQGPRMWRDDVRLAVVEHIAGRRQLAVRLRGSANHAGSTPMDMRRDALAGAAEMVLELERLASRVSADAVVTVGRLACQPGAINVIASEAEFSVDFRAPENGLLAAGLDKIQALVEAIATRRELESTVDVLESLPAVPMDAGLCGQLRAAAGRLGVPRVGSATSGALHDAAILAAFMPTAMLFVPSRDGISHNPAEFSRADDLAVAAAVLGEVVREAGTSA